ncbi:Bcr/CflA subfamily drug resistance transporter [Lentibacillus jeotgali]|uniref:Bcr/CflA subfamily drug resistance transporter n=1 Tax=Lentibacillus jeotgali TaxID=558169 RepID=UPI0002628BA2|nr:Bcr/CflA subfamily drug resistance transporter [Lentibacillus jeotgali]
MSEMKQTIDQQETSKHFNKVWMVLILGALTAFGPLSMNMYLPGLPAVTDGFQTTASLAQLSITATLIGLYLLLME